MRLTPEEAKDLFKSIQQNPDMPGNITKPELPAFIEKLDGCLDEVLMPALRAAVGEQITNEKLAELHEASLLWVLIAVAQKHHSRLTVLAAEERRRKAGEVMEQQRLSKAELAARAAAANEDPPEKVKG